jgi:hypothetical protein
MTLADLAPVPLWLVFAMGALRAIYRGMTGRDWGDTGP